MCVCVCACVCVCVCVCEMVEEKGVVVFFCSVPLTSNMFDLKQARHTENNLQHMFKHDLYK